MNKKEILSVKFWSRVEKLSENECWNWTGNVSAEGYGRFWDGSGQNRKMCYGHRFSYEFHKGQIPKKLVVDHMCRNRKCVNPHHLQLLTMPQNFMLNSNSSCAINKAKTHCIYGHEFTKENTTLKYRKCRPNPSRSCNECAKTRSGEWVRTKADLFKKYEEFYLKYHEQFD